MEGNILFIMKNYPIVTKNSTKSGPGCLTFCTLIMHSYRVYSALTLPWLWKNEGVCMYVRVISHVRGQPKRRENKINTKSNCKGIRSISRPTNAFVIACGI